MRAPLRSALLVGGIVASVNGVAHAEEPAIGDQQHGGFYFRADLGLGYMQANAPIPNASIAVSGLEGSFALAVGGAIADNLIIAGEVWSQAVSGPKVSLNGVSTSTSNDVSLDLVGIGPNITYYLMPANVYASLTPSLARLSVSDGRAGSTEATPFGFAARGAIGKEWWVARHLGLGAAATFSIAFNADEATVGATKTEFFWTTVAGGLAFVGTYN